MHCPASLEDNRRRLHSRISRIIPDQAMWPENLHFATAAKRLDKGSLDSIEAWIKSRSNPRLIILDTFAAFRPPRMRGDSGYEADYSAIAGLRELANEYGVAIVVVHHLGKQSADDPIDTVSGTTGLTAAADSVLVLSREGQGIVLRGRGRDLEELELAMRFDQNSCKWQVLGEADKVLISDERKKILRCLAESNEALGPDAIAKAIGRESGPVRQLLGRMVANGEVLKAARGQYLAAPSDNGHKVTFDEDEESIPR